jgi:hypothetical protein
MICMIRNMGTQSKDWDATWRRIVALEGETFHQKRGKPFQYTHHYGAIHPTTTNRALPRSHFEQAHARLPLNGPGDIQDLQGPSYIWAILNDSRVSGGRSVGRIALASAPTLVRKIEAVPPSRGMPGTKVTIEDLASLGLIPLELRLRDPVELGFGQVGIAWDTLGEVPRTPGIYAFTVESDGDLRVCYVGLTTHLWMVTHGRLPEGTGRGGQRYGRPKHAGVTRQRINVLVAEQVRLGRVVTHWVKPVDDLAGLRLQEEGLIATWNLRLAGWNRG